MKTQGRRIRTLAQLMQASLDKRAVIGGPIFRRPCAAAFIIGMPGTVIHGFLQHGLYLYKTHKPKCVCPKRDLTWYEFISNRRIEFKNHSGESRASLTSPRLLTAGTDPVGHQAT